jgi:hypothetical protein
VSDAIVRILPGRKSMIDAVSFGSITIEGNTYHSDLILFPDGRVTDHWRRQAGHRLTYEDIQPLVAAGPEVIVAGCGISGMMKPETALAEILAEKGIEFLAAPNAEAIRMFNRRSSGKKTGACFHLTC